MLSMPENNMNATTGRAGVIKAREDSGAMDKLVGVSPGYVPFCGFAQRSSLARLGVASSSGG